ncbi:pre-peptidase C-terminal domain-containing protein [Thalassotalea fusca]
MVNKYIHAISLCVTVFITTSIYSCYSRATTFAVIGDFGEVGTALDNVSSVINNWQPDFVLTLGDNDYEDDYTKSVVPYFSDFISDNCENNQFFPTFGNHDWNGPHGYDDVFPCINEYYRFSKANIDFFTINSDSLTPVQKRWLEDELQNSDAEWKIVFLHHTPYSSGRHGNNSQTQLDYAGWGADIVLAAHDHVYERIERDGIYYFVNGLGGRAPYNFDNCCVTGSKFRYNDSNGAMRFDVNDGSMRIRFIDQTNTTIDDVTLTKSPSAPSSTQKLSNGVSATVSANKDEQLLFSFDLPENSKNLVVQTSGGTGDADLYVKFLEPPTTSSYDCRPWKNGSTEACLSLEEKAGTWQIMLHAFATFENVELLVSWE